MWYTKAGNVFILSLLIFKFISILIFYTDKAYSPVLDLYYHFFSIKELIQYITMNAMPTAWPSNIYSYTYDFSVVYMISSHFDIISNKSLIMPDNILPYGPLAFLLFHALSFFKIETALFLYRTVTVILFCSVIFMASMRISSQILKNISICTVLILLSTPLFTFVFSGNIEIIIFSLSFLALLLMKKKPIFSAMMICICIAIKYYPIIFLLEFLKDKQYKIFFISIIVAATLFFVPFLFFHGGFLENFLFTVHQITKSSRVCYDDAAVFCSVGGLSMAEFFYNLGFNIEFENLLYKISAFIVFTTGLYCYIKISSRSLALMILIAVICLVPQVSVFYKLSYFMIPIFLNNNENRIISYIIATLVALCLSPLPFYFAMNLSNIKGDFSFLIFLIYLFLLMHCFREQKKIRIWPIYRIETMANSLKKLYSIYF